MSDRLGTGGTLLDWILEEFKSAGVMFSKSIDGWGVKGTLF